MKIKHGVDVSGMHSEVWPSMMRLDSYLRGSNFSCELTITSAKDGKHSKHSRHYIGTAVDLRTWNNNYSGTQLKGDKRQDFWNVVKEVLGPDWFVLDEHTHFHCDYRPTYKKRDE